VGGASLTKVLKKRASAAVIPALTVEAKLKRSIRAHFTRLGFTKGVDGQLELPAGGKDVVRKLHSGQRVERLNALTDRLKSLLPIALSHFATGAEIDPAKIKLRLKRVDAGTSDSDLFRIASFTWSVPVSNGYGRRLRYLVWDEHHQRVAGIIALGDPVFNLSVRDRLIGWTSDDRSERLVNLLDAYVLGAVPPYSFLLGGKAVACLVRSKEVYADFRKAYGSTTGIISGEEKHARLLAVTTTSSMGRSSIYNRLKLAEMPYFEQIGYTLGWGHFHITDELFAQMRESLRLAGHPYADKHKFGEGPNWRLRTIRVALAELGINESVLKHGIQREVFLCTYAKNAIQILKTGKGRPDVSDLKSVAEISELAKDRWILPRAERRPEFATWQREDVNNLIYGIQTRFEREQMKAA
jgi:Domain of unknown function (DUF4338)